jgi:glycosyltransferase involved in cell wall biosynthesis
MRTSIKRFTRRNERAESKVALMPIAGLSASVIIATYRRAGTLERCLKSLATQTTPPQEVIVVWQGDDIETQQMAEQFAGGAPFRLKVVHQPEPGIVPAENAGLDAANGEIILLIDDDVIAPPAWVLRHLAHYEDPSVGAVGGPYMNHHPDGREFDKRQPQKVGKLEWYGRFVGNLFDHVEAWQTRPPSRVDHLAGNNMSIRREAFSRFEESLRPYWQLFEAEACLQVKARGYQVLFDWANRIDHFPTNDLFIQDREGDLARKVFNWAYNHAFILAKHRGRTLGLVGLAYLWFVGSAANPGLLGFVRAISRYGGVRRELMILRSTLACHGKGWQDGLACRNGGACERLTSTASPRTK